MWLRERLKDIAVVPSLPVPYFYRGSHLPDSIFWGWGNGVMAPSIKAHVSALLSDFAHEI